MGPGPAAAAGRMAARAGSPGGGPVRDQAMGGARGCCGGPRGGIGGRPGRATSCATTTKPAGRIMATGGAGGSATPACWHIGQPGCRLAFGASLPSGPTRMVRWRPEGLHSSTSCAAAVPVKGRRQEGSAADHCRRSSTATRLRRGRRTWRMDGRMRISRRKPCHGQGSGVRTSALGPPFRSVPCSAPVPLSVMPRRPARSPGCHGPAR